ncbi:hypothetical protein CCACVL1_30590 [Corchorus capsularis]|uniref:Uncharacterized protein n=1 Tax=Corchorus capsularis TaxID=210143 RepID=A0A1R3FWL0_COCAP|nr:hypothetical protein CCACVL1_30590 [Corchorus capsularis]
MVKGVASCYRSWAARRSVSGC